MGSSIEINDTLQITTAQGFPDKILNLERHKRSSIGLEEVSGLVLAFHDKPGARVFHVAPTRCFLVHNIDGKWLYWGKILILEQTIHGSGENGLMTSGMYRIIEIYDRDYQAQITMHESPKGMSYF